MIREIEFNYLQKKSRGLATEVERWSIVGYTFYIIGLMDYNACSAIMANHNCYDYWAFMIVNIVVVFIAACIPHQSGWPYKVSCVVTCIFILCHAILVGLSLTDSGCMSAINTGCEAQAFEGYNILHYYSLILLSWVAFLLVMVIICAILYNYGFCCCSPWIKTLGDQVNTALYSHLYVDAFLSERNDQIRLSEIRKYISNPINNVRIGR